MKSFIARFFIFSLPVLLLVIPADLFLSNNLKKSESFVSGEYMVWNDIYESKINADLLIYGASRAMVSFNTSLMEDSLNRSCFNMGLNGLGFWHIYLRHREYLKHNKPPKYIIYSIDITALVKDESLYNEDQFLPYMFCDKNMYKYLSKINSFNFFDFYIPMVRYFGRRNAIDCALKNFLFRKDTVPYRTKGYVGMDLQWNDDFDNAREKLDRLEIKVDSTSIDLFDDFLHECKMKNIKVIFVYAPEYIEGQEFVKNREDVIKLYSEFSKKYNIPFIDYSNDDMCYQKKYFYNSSHLNRTGSNYFTEKFIRYLKNSNSEHGICVTDKNK